MKFVYFGSSGFSRVVLEELFAQGYTPSLIVSQPDKPRSRGLKVLPLEVSMFAQEKHFLLLKPCSLHSEEFIQRIKKESAETFVVADYGKLLPPELLALSGKIPIALHPSLLPCYRGAAPVNWALIHGEKETGNTVFRVREKLDSGEILLQERVCIAETDNAISLHRKLARKGADLLIKALDQIKRNEYMLTAQNEAFASFAPKLSKKDGKISWDADASTIRNLIRGTLGWPSAYTDYKKITLKILETQIVETTVTQAPATIVRIDKNGIYVATAKNLICIQKVQPQGKKPMDAYAFVLGHNVTLGEQFT
ncbi:MAG: methionyl-tRNA formyltransferase [Candidatus Omnitrophota bacterium]